MLRWCTGTKFDRVSVSECSMHFALRCAEPICCIKDNSQDPTPDEIAKKLEASGRMSTLQSEWTVCLAFLEYRSLIDFQALWHSIGCFEFTLTVPFRTRWHTIGTQTTQAFKLDRPFQFKSR